MSQVLSRSLHRFEKLSSPGLADLVGRVKWWKSMWILLPESPKTYEDEPSSFLLPSFPSKNHMGSLLIIHLGPSQDLLSWIL